MDNEAILGNAVLMSLRRRLPVGWSIEMHRATEGDGPDAWLDLTTGKGFQKRFAVEIKHRFEPKDVDRVLRQISRWKTKTPALLIAPHLTPRSQDVLSVHGISYADVDGNVRLYDDPLLVTHRGETKRSGRFAPTLKRSSLRGHLTARVVRYILECRPPLKVRQIAADTGTDPGNVSHLVKLLENERFIKRDERASVVDVEWEGLIRAWGHELQKDRVAQTFLEPRGIGTVTKRLAVVSSKYAITGSFAASQIVPTALSASIDIYAEDIFRFANDIGVKTTEGIGNVRIIQAYDDVVFQRTLQRNGLVLANASQIAADLITLPKRSSEEYNELIAWMKNHESFWRTA